MSENTRIKVRISNPDHPHFDEVGHLTGKVILVNKKPMAQVDLENCPDGTESCYVKMGDAVRL